MELKIIKFQTLNVFERMFPILLPNLEVRKQYGDSANAANQNETQFQTKFTKLKFFPARTLIVKKNIKQLLRILQIDSCLNNQVSPVLRRFETCGSSEF